MHFIWHFHRTLLINLLLKSQFSSKFIYYSLHSKSKQVNSWAYIFSRMYFWYKACNIEYSSSFIVKSYIRKAQLGEIFIFDKVTVLSDGVFRFSSRGWYSLVYVVLSTVFFLFSISKHRKIFISNMCTVTIRLTMRQEICQK